MGNYTRFKTSQISIQISMIKAKYEKFYSRVPFLLSIILLVISVGGCATFLGNDLPDYTFADISSAPPPEKRVCLIVNYKNCDKECHEFYDPAYEMLEKSGFFRRDCTPNPDGKNNLQMNELYELKIAYHPLALISVGISVLTLGIIPGYAHNNVTARIQINKKDRIIKEYVYHEHADLWVHLSMLFIRSEHNNLAINKKFRKRLYMNFLHDFSDDFNNGLYELNKITSPPDVSASK